MSVAAEKNARNHALFREVNERIAELNGEWDETAASTFICECGDPECTEPLELTPTEYERVRADGARFLILPGHQLPERERVIGGNGRFLVVETLGQAAKLARAATPDRP